jgi:hypothetical protein
MRIGQQFLEQAMDPPCVAAPFGGLLALDRVEFLEDLHGYREVVLLEFEEGLGVVQQDVRIQDVGLDPGTNLMLR